MNKIFVATAICFLGLPEASAHDFFSPKDIEYMVYENVGTQPFLWGNSMSGHSVKLKNKQEYLDCIIKNVRSEAYKKGKIMSMDEVEIIVETAQKLCSESIDMDFGFELEKQWADDNFYTFSYESCMNDEKTQTNLPMFRPAVFCDCLARTLTNLFIKTEKIHEQHAKEGVFPYKKVIFASEITALYVDKDFMNAFYLDLRKCLDSNLSVLYTDEGYEMPIKETFQDIPAESDTVVSRTMGYDIPTSQKEIDAIVDSIMGPIDR